jgi:hypothetical protein
MTNKYSLAFFSLFCLIFSSISAQQVSQQYEDDPFLENNNGFFDGEGYPEEVEENNQSNGPTNGTNNGKAYRLNVGDSMIISVYGDEKSKREVTIDPRGMISYMFVDSLQAAGKTITQLRDDLIEQLRNFGSHSHKIQCGILLSYRLC